MVLPTSKFSWPYKQCYSCDSTVRWSSSTVYCEVGCEVPVALILSPYHSRIATCSATNATTSAWRSTPAPTSSNSCHATLQTTTASGPLRRQSPSGDVVDHYGDRTQVVMCVDHFGDNHCGDRAQVVICGVVSRREMWCVVEVDVRNIRYKL